MSKSEISKVKRREQSDTKHTHTYIHLRSWQEREKKKEKEEKEKSKVWKVHLHSTSRIIRLDTDGGTPLVAMQR